MATQARNFTRFTKALLVRYDMSRKNVSGRQCLLKWIFLC